MSKSGRKCHAVAMATGARGEKRPGARQPRTRREARKQVCIPFKIPPWTFTREIFCSTIIILLLWFFFVLTKKISAHTPKREHLSEVTVVGEDE